MPFQSAQEGIQRGGYDGPYGQTTAFRMFAEKFCRSWWKLQSDRNRGLGNFDRSIEPRRFLEVAIRLALGKIELARQLTNCIGERQMTLQQDTRGVQMLSLLRFG